MTDPVLRTLSPSDLADGVSLLDAVDGVLMRAYGGPPRRSRVLRYLRVQPDGWVAAEDGAGVAAVGGCVAYVDGGFGWIGLVATDPDRQRCGLGTRVTQRLVEILAAHGCASVLDASAAGAPVYARMGFVGMGPTVGYTAPASVRPMGAMQATPGWGDGLYAYDRECFGADRSALLRIVLAEAQGVWTVGERGSVRGYAVLGPGSIGPVVADDAEALSALMSRVLAAGGAGLPMTVAPDSGHHATLRSLGFDPVRTLEHMRLGIGDLPGRRASLCAQISLGEG